MELKDFLLKYFENAIEIVSSEPSYKEFCGFALEVEKEMVKEGINEMAASRLFSPLYERLALDKLKKKEEEFNIYVVVKEALFKNEADIIKGITKWKLKEKTKSMTKEEKEKFVEEIIEKNKEFYKANIEKFNLDLILS